MWIIKLPFYFLKVIFKSLTFVLKKVCGFFFGWIPDINKKMTGEDFEEYVKEILQRNGYKHVRLTKRSGDYGVDILAEYKGETYGIQCKLYQKPVGVAAVQQVYAGSQYYECDWAVVVTNQTFTRQAITLADSNDVMLWNGEMLEKMKRQANRRTLLHRYPKEEVHEQLPHPYQKVIHLLLREGYASTQLLMDELYYSEEKAFYILEDFYFHDLVSTEDHLGIRDLYFLSYEEAMDNLNDEMMD